MPQITIDLDKDTLGALALGAMNDNVTVNEYISTCVVELAKIIEQDITNPQVEEEVVTTEAPVAQQVVEDSTGVSPTPEQKPGGPGAPLYNKKESGTWRI